MMKPATNISADVQHVSRFQVARFHAARMQAGDVLLFVLFAMLIILLGALYSMRGLFDDTVAAGNDLQRTKNIQAGDMALALAHKTVVNTLGGQNGSVALQIAAEGQTWFFNPGGTAAWPAPGTPGSANETYWLECTNGSSTKPCFSLANMPGGYTARMIIVPTNQPSDPGVCNTTGYAAIFYNIFINVKESNGLASANVESVYMQCVLDANVGQL